MQDNENDCGVYVCMFARQILFNLSLQFQPEHVQQFREWMKDELVRNVLNTSWKITFTEKAFTLCNIFTSFTTTFLFPLRFIVFPGYKTFVSCSLWTSLLPAVRRHDPLISNICNLNVIFFYLFHYLLHILIQYYNMLYTWFVLFNLSLIKERVNLPLYYTSAIEYKNTTRTPIPNRNADIYSEHPF